MREEPEVPNIPNDYSLFNIVYLLFAIAFRKP